MTETDLKKLKEELALAVGFKRLPLAKSNWHYEHVTKVMDWETPSMDNVKGYYPPTMQYLPDFPHSMDECLKWIEPKLIGLLDISRLLPNKYYCEIRTSVYTKYEGMEETIPIAFCLAAKEYFKEIRK